MIHQPMAGMEGTAEDIMIHAKEFTKVKERLNRILIKHTGHPLEKIERDTDRDRFMSAEEGPGIRPDRPGHRARRAETVMSAAHAVCRFSNVSGTLRVPY